jgi:hypothetical protein
MPSAITADVPQMTVIKRILFRTELDSRMFLNLLREGVALMERLASPVARLNLVSKWSFLHHRPARVRQSEYTFGCCLSVPKTISTVLYIFVCIRKLDSD